MSARSIELSDGLPKHACVYSTKSALISCRTIIFVVGDIGVGIELKSKDGHSFSVGSFVLEATMIPELSWTICIDVAVNVAVQPLLQKSAVEFSDRSS